MKKQVLYIEGMDCASCAVIIKRELRDLIGVHQVAVSYLNGKIMIRYDEHLIDLNTIIEKLLQLQFNVAHYSSGNTPLNKKILLLSYVLSLTRSQVVGFLVGLLSFGLLIMMPTTLNQLVIISFFINVFLARYFVHVWSALIFYVKFLPELFLCIASLFSYLVGIFLWLRPGSFCSHTIICDSQWFLMFSIVCLLASLFVVIIYTYMNHYLMMHGLNLQADLPLKVSVKVDQTDHWLMVPFNQVPLTSLVRAHEGEKIGVDGIVVSGEAYIADPLIPTHLYGKISKVPGDYVLAGMLVTHGKLEIKPQQTGIYTLRTTIVESFKQNRLHLQDKYSLVDIYRNKKLLAVLFSWCLFFLVIMYLGGYINSIALIAYMIVGMFVTISTWILDNVFYYIQLFSLNKALKEGIILYDPLIFNLIKPKSYMVIEPSGFLFDNNLDVWGLHTYGNLDKFLETLYIFMPGALSGESFILMLLVLTAEQYQSDLSRAIVHYLYYESTIKPTGNRVPLKKHHHDDYRVMIVTGPGIIVEVMPYDYMVSQHMSLPSDIVTKCNSYDAEGKVSWIMRVNGSPVIYFCTVPTIPMVVKEFITNIKNMGIQPVILSASRFSVIEYVAKQLQINRYYAQINARDKVFYIERLKEDGHTVIMVSNNTADAPALSVADVGIVYYGTDDIVRRIAPVVLLKKDLSLITEFIRISMMTSYIGKKYWRRAYLYHLVMIPIMGGGWYYWYGYPIWPEIGLAITISVTTLFLLSIFLLEYIDLEK